jgi:inner membrane protein
LLRQAHLLFAAAVGFILIRTLRIELNINSIIIALLTMIGGIIPDIDILFGHRKLLHNVFASSLFALMAYMVTSFLVHETGLLIISPLYSSLAIMLGMLSHIFLDMLTVRGVAVLYPLTTSRVRILRLRARDPYANRIIEILSATIIAYIILSTKYIYP